MSVIEMLTLFPIIVSLLGVSAYGQQPKAITNSLGMTLVLILKGSFTMGSPSTDAERNVRELQHEVTLSQSFYLGMCEVTQGQYAKVIGNNNNRATATTIPVRNVSWEDANAFCKKLSELPDEKAAGRFYRLPTEAEWEYSCRATSGAAYSFGDSSELLGEFAWFKDGPMFGEFPVGLKKANRWGVYDMHGNVHEWCHDWYAEYPSDDVTDPKGPRVGTERVFRGGSASDSATKCRSSSRYWILPSFSSTEIGFRVAMCLPANSSEPEPTTSK